MDLSSSPLISIEKASICYRRGGRFLFSGRKTDRKLKEFWALREISFSAYQGDVIGLIGRNGAGKSTCSKLISGALKPDSGSVKVRGKTHLLSLGTGFKPALTGRENVMLSGTIMGLSRKQVAAGMDNIEAFADIGEFFDEPLKIYSSGMRSRLGFAVSTAVKPDILILDEVMSTGDASFRKKAEERLEKMKESTKIIIMVSHSVNQIKEQCNKVVWLEKGEVIMVGEAGSVMNQYETFCEDPNQWLGEHGVCSDEISKASS
jgi:ABC-type polysaccharide/polyol phosphate transport system ATPase subunit